MMREAARTEAWENYIMCKTSWGHEYQIGTKLVSQCGVLLGDPSLAACVRYALCLWIWNIQTPALTDQRTLVVDFVDKTEKTTKLFVECLAALSNLHTLEIISMEGEGKVQSFVTALEELQLQLQLQKVRTLVLPPKAHRLLEYCPNVEDLTCCAAEPDEAFAESLVEGGLNRVTKFSLVYPGDIDIWPSRVHFILSPHR